MLSAGRHIRLLALTVWISVFILIFHAGAEDSLYVFYPTTFRPQTLQDKLGEELKGISITVMGRYKDFVSKIETSPPSVIITNPALVQQIGQYTPVLRAVRNGSARAKYVLLSLNEPLSPDAVTAEMSIGILDILGRTGTKTFTSGFFTTEPKIKRVIKVEDLLPLLSFNMVSAVLVEDVFVGYFKSVSRMEFFVTDVSGPDVGILVVAVKNGETAESCITLLKSNSKEISRLFEVDSWK